MKKYLVEVENYFGCVVYSEYCYGEDENQALIKVLKDEKIVVSCGDKLSLEEV